MMPLSSKVRTSSISPSNKSEIKQAPPLGVTAISIPLSSKIPGTLHSELSAINSAPYFSHGLEHFGEEFA